VFFSLYPHEIIAYSTLDVSLTPGGLQIFSHAAHKTSYTYIHVGSELQSVEKKI
jgi:hypothetical protein